MKYPIVKRFYAVRPLQFMLEDPEGYYIVSYQEKCPITGRPTNDTFYMIIVLCMFICDIRHSLDFCINLLEV